MKKILLALTAVLAMVGTAHATNGNNDPKGGNAEAIAASSSTAIAGANASAAQQQGQQQGQGQLQGQGQSQGYSGSQEIRIESTRQSPAVIAPALTSAGTGVCLGSISGGVSVMGAGASLGMTKVDKGCERRSGAALLYQMGYRDAALKLLMNDDEIREAMGVSVPAKPAAAEVVTPSTTTIQSTNFGQ